MDEPGEMQALLDELHETFVADTIDTLELASLWPGAAVSRAGAVARLGANIVDALTVRSQHRDGGAGAVVDDGRLTTCLAVAVAEALIEAFAAYGGARGVVLRRYRAFALAACARPEDVRVAVARCHLQLVTLAGALDSSHPDELDYMEGITGERADPALFVALLVELAALLLIWLREAT